MDQELKQIADGGDEDMRRRIFGGAGERQAEEVSREVSDLSQNPKIKELAASSATSEQ